MEFVLRFKELHEFMVNADFTDVKRFEGHATLRGFIASMLSYQPWWLVQLYRLRELLVRVLGLVRHAAPPELPNLRPEDVPFAPGEKAAFFTVRSAEEGLFWFAETPDDRHLSAYFGVVRESVTSTVSRFHVVTTVFYKHWTGPVYFNLIRPFHHLVVRRMALHGVTH